MEGFMKQFQAAGMPWFEEDDYDAFRSLLPTRSWHDTHAEWKRAAEQQLDKLARQGVVAVKAHVRSDAFLKWCAAAGRDIDTHALLAFGNEVAVRAFSKNKRH
jgi:hypothetical protein